MMDDSEEALVLTFEEANILFGFSETCPVNVLQSLYMRYKHQLHSANYHEFRMLLTIVRILTRIKNEDTRYMVRSLNSKFMKEQFRGKPGISCRLLHYIFSLTWHFRNCSSLDDISTVGHDRVFISKFREQLASAGIGVQLELSI
jgi:hypothetical protein